VIPVLTRASLLDFLRGHRYAVEASVAAASGVQAAVVGIAVSERFEIVFDTLETTRKAQNLRSTPASPLLWAGCSRARSEPCSMRGWPVDRLAQSFVPRKNSTFARSRMAASGWRGRGFFICA
jgi:hypothetical protein